MTIPLKVALPGFIVFWVCVATLVSFLPVYFSAVKTVDDTSMTLANTIATNVHERTLEYLNAPARVTAEMGDVFRNDVDLSNLGFPVTVNGVRRGVWSMEAQSNAVNRVLNSVSVAKSGYAFAFNTDLQVMATTWGASVVKEVNISGDVSREIVSFADLAPHRSIGDVADVGGLTNAMLDHNASGAVILKKETGEFYFRMGEIKDEYGLHLYFVVVIPKSDFFDEIEAERTKVIIGVVVVSVTMCVIAVVATRMLLPALERIAFRMTLSAQLSDNDPADPLSSITELREMQESYEKMRTELNRIKVFLPAAMTTCDVEGEEGMMSASVLSTLSSSSSSRWAKPSKVTAADLHKSMAYDLGASIGPKIQVGASLLEKDLTVMVINVRGFHKVMVNASDDDWLVSEHRELFDTVYTAITDHRGVLDTFNGDHFVATFNATRVCAQHAKHAAIAFCSLQSAIKNVSPTFSDLSVGIATGPAMVGNMGNTMMQRFCIMGPVYSQAVALEKMTASYNTSVLANPLASREIHLVVYYQYVDVVQLPHATQEGPVATFGELREETQKEWMYAIEENDRADPFADINEAFVCAMDGDAEKARGLLQALKPDTDCNVLLGLPFIEKRLRLLSNSTQQMPSLPAPPP